MIRTVPYPEAARQIKLDYDGPRWTPAHEVQVLCWLAQQTDGGILEIGCNEGRTTREMALACPDRPVIGIDYSGDDDTLCPEQKGEKPRPEHIGCQARCLPNVAILEAKSENINTKLLPCGLGLIFIDGDHTYNGVSNDTELALESLRHGPSNSIIVWHDCYPETDTSPKWVGVWKYLSEISQHFDIKLIEGTWLAVLSQSSTVI